MSNIQENLLPKVPESYPTSYYKNYRNPPINVSNFDLTNNSMPIVLFQIPGSQVYNLYHSILSFNLRVSIPFGANPVVIFKNYISFFNKLELFTSNNNVRLIDITNFDLVSKMICNYELDYKNRNNEMDWFCVPSKRSKLYDPIYDDDLNVIGIGGVANNATEAPYCDVIMGTNFDGFNGMAPSFLSPAYMLKLNAHTDPESTTAIYDLKISIKIRDMIPSLFSINMDLYNQSYISLRFTFNNLSNIACSLTTSTLDTNGLAISNQTFTVSNMLLHLFAQNNAEIVNMITERSKQQQVLVIPTIYQSQSTYNQSMSQRATYKLTSQTTDARLYKIWYALLGQPYICNPQNTANLNISTTNITGTNAISNPSKYSQNNLYLGSNLILQQYYNSNDFYHYAILNSKHHSFPTIDDFNYNGVIMYKFDSDCVDDDEYNGSRIIGEVMSNGFLDISLQLVTSNNAFTHYIVALMFIKIYMKNGVISLNPFVE